MGLIDKIFGGDETRKALINGVDDVIYTNEERAKQFEKYLELYHPFKLNQRVIAWLVSGSYTLAWVATFASEFVGREVPRSVIDLLDGKLGEAFGYIVAFYFLGGALNGVATMVRNK